MIINFLKNIMKYGKKNEKLMRIQFESKRTYGYNNHKYIRTILKIYAVSMITFS